MQDYIALFRRRRSVMFAAFATIAIGVVFGTLLLQDQYRSTATIAIERPEIPENMVRTTVPTSTLTCGSIEFVTGFLLLLRLRDGSSNSTCTRASWPRNP